MSNRYLKVDAATRYVTSIVVGSLTMPGVEFVEQSADNSNVAVGWSYVDGAFSDTTAAYKAARTGRPA